MNIVAIVLEILLGLMFLMAGVMKLTGAKMHVDNFSRMKLPQWFRVITGLVELVGAVAILIGIWVHSWAAWAGVLLALTMVGAIAAHLRSKDPAGQTVVPILLLIIAVIVSILHGSSFVNFLG
jgi:putative oxidoreductase